MTVFIDTSYLKALLDTNDTFHGKAVTIWKKFLSGDTALITTNYILDESFTLVRIRRGLPIALRLRELLAQYASQIKIIRVTLEDEARAWNWFEKDWSKLSYTDCTAFALMQRLGIKNVASFDDHFTRAGFTVIKP